MRILILFIRKINTCQQSDQGETNEVSLCGDSVPAAVSVGHFEGTDIIRRKDWDDI